MAEKDANYYYNRALQARQHGNERLAQYMENYARQLDRDLGRGADGRDGYGVTEVPYTQPPTPARNENLYQRYVASQVPPVVPSPPPSYNYSGFVDDPEAKMQADFMAKSAKPASGTSIYDYSRDMRAGRYDDNVVGVGGDIRDINPDDYRDGGYITSANNNAPTPAPNQPQGRRSRWSTQASPSEVLAAMGNWNPEAARARSAAWNEKIRNAFNPSNWYSRSQAIRNKRNGQ